MIRLDKEHYNLVYKLYLKTSQVFFFPLIAAVLLDEQDGNVYVNNVKSPSQAYVEHHFGFSQIFGQSIKDFELSLEQYLFINKQFNPSKIRLYTPHPPQFLTFSNPNSQCSYRQRFSINPVNFSYNYEQEVEPLLRAKLSIMKIDANNISKIETHFGLTERFWRNKIDFILKSNASVVCYQDIPASICYSAAEANHSVEIDVLTLPEYRTLGLGKIAVKKFVDQCLALSLDPLWDCFTNNAGSMRLCQSVGFVALEEPYPFFTINK